MEVSISDALSSLTQKLILSDIEVEDLSAFSFSSFLMELKSFQFETLKGLVNLFPIAFTQHTVASLL